MQFLGNYSGHFARLTCNHSYGYAFRPIEQIYSLTDFIKYTPLSTFSCNMRVSNPGQTVAANNRIGLNISSGLRRHHVIYLNFSYILNVAREQYSFLDSIGK